ncbi:MAG: hypothetical protein KIT85_02160 [Pseudolabrys sp.]|nr:hypothetical protein [Pseudolabrys sp.]
MRTSLTIARLIGPVLTVIGLGLLINNAAYREIVRQFTGSYLYMYLSGVLVLLAGLAILNAHNVWSRDWRVVITLLGLFFTLMGVFRVLAPPFVNYVGGALIQQPGVLIVIGVVFLGIGSFLTFKGYVA